MARSGVATSSFGNPTNDYGVLAFINSNFGLLFFQGTAILYEVDPATLAITVHNTLTMPTYTGNPVTGDNGVMLSDTVCVMNVAARNSGTGGIDGGQCVITRTGTSISIGPMNAPANMNNIATFGFFLGPAIRIDATHFALSWSYTFGTFISMFSVSGTTVTELANSTFGSPYPNGLLMLLDATHLLANDQNSNTNFYVHTFTTGGGVSATAGPTTPTGVPGGVSSQDFGAARAGGAGDFLVTYFDATAMWLQPAHWNGSSLVYGTAISFANVSAYTGLAVAGRTSLIAFPGGDMGGSLDRHVIVANEGAGDALQAGIGALSSTAMSAYTPNPLAAIKAGFGPTLHPGNVAVLMLSSATFGSPLYLQAVQGTPPVVPGGWHIGAIAMGPNAGHSPGVIAGNPQLAYG